MWWWSLYLWNERLIISAEDFSRFGGSIRFNSKIVFSWLFVVSLFMEAMGLPSPFFCFMHLLTILFVSLILTCLYLYVYPRSKLERKEIVSVTGVSYSWKTLKTSKMNGIVWRELNLRLAVSKDINRSVLVEKIITHRKRPFQVEPMDEEQKFMIGTRIGRYKPSGLRDLSRDRAIKEPYWGPLVFVHDI